MIRFSLKCANDHSFESWFQSNEAYDKLAASGMVSCPDCADTRITKAIMAPPVRSSRKAAATAVIEASEQEKALAKLREHVESTSDYVGMNFASEARDMHDGLIDERPIYGEAKWDEAKKLIEDGVPVAPLPFTPKAKQN